MLRTLLAVTFMWVFAGPALAQGPGSGDRMLTIAAFGDSLSAGYGLESKDAFPARLEAALRAAGETVRVVNAGVSGDTTAGGLARVDWVLGDKPDLVILELGANDMLRGLSPARAEANLDAILTKLGERKVPVLLAGMLASRSLGSDYTKEFDPLYQRLADKHKVPLYPFFLDGVALDQALNQPDLLHPNAKGVDVIVARILPHVRKLIASTRAAARPPV
jgi:acyl-CoA thioesterase-1